MKLFNIGVIVGVLVLGAWHLFQKFDQGRKPTAVVFAQTNIPTEHKPLFNARELKQAKALSRESREVTEGIRTNHAPRPSRVAKADRFQLMRDPLPARGPLTTPELALELEIARLNELRAQSTEANRLVGDIMAYFEKIRGNKRLSKRFANLPTDQNGLAIFDESFGEQMIEDRATLAKWKKLMQISHATENTSDEEALSSL